MAWSRAWREPAGLAALSAVAALCVYGIARVCAARFYGPLGVRAEDLKIGYPELVERSLGVVAYAFVLGIPFVAMAVGSAWLWKRKAWDEPWSEDGRNLLLITAAVVPLLVVVLLVIGYGVLLSALALLIGSVVAMVAWPRAGEWLLPVAVLSFTLLAGMLGWMMWATAGNDAQRAKLGISADAKLFGVPVVPWRSDVAHVEWNGRVPFGLTRSLCVLVLVRCDGKRDTGVCQ